jgi:opacity protein-like surface antigen
MRSKFWKSILALTAVIAGGGAGGAADLAVKAPVYKAPPVILSDWAGFYLGVHGGYGWEDSSFTALIGPSPAAAVPGTIGIKPTGGVFGGHVGYNWQFGSVVVGVEGDFDGADINGTNNNFNPPASLKTDELASARGRLGYAVLPNLLAYGTGGFGWARSDLNVFNRGGEGFGRDGWTAGAGLEYRFYGNWIARAEYLHYGFDSKLLSDTTLKDNGVNVVRGGVSYKF